MRKPKHLHPKPNQSMMFSESNEDLPLFAGGESGGVRDRSEPYAPTPVAAEELPAAWCNVRCDKPDCDDCQEA